MNNIDLMFKGAFLGIFSAILIFIIFNKCNSSEKQHIQHNRIIEYIDKEIKTTDTLIKTKTIVRNKEVEKLVPYEHIIYVPNYKLCQDTTQIDSLKTLCFMQRKTIKLDDSLFVLYRKNDSLHVKKDTLNKKVIDSLINSKDKYWKGYWDATKILVPISFSIGVGVGAMIKK